MCGIIGMMTTNKQGFFVQDQDALKGMLVVNSLRGAHSTGLAGVPKQYANKEKVDTIKSVGSPYSLFDWKMFENFSKRMVWDYNVVIGHGRYATHGKINADNAHPFEQDHIVLVHNGMISNWGALKDYPQHKDIEVDSQLVAQLIAEKGADEVLSSLRGAYVLVWYDKNDGSLNFARNKERPLFIAETDHGIYFASEKETLLWAAGKYNVKMKSVTALPTNTWVSYPHMSREPVSKEYLPAIDYSYYEYGTYKKAEEKVETSRFNGKKHREEVDDEYSIHLLEMLAELDDEDDEVSIIKESSVTCVLDDYQITTTHCNLKLVSNQYPNIEMWATCGLSVSEESLLSANSFRGKVRKIYPVESHQTVNGATWRAFLKDVMMVSTGTNGKDHMSVIPSGIIGEHTAEILSLEPWVTLTAVDGTEERFSNHRYTQLLSEGCWNCKQQITEKEADNPKSLILLQDKKGSHLICPSCADIWALGEISLKEVS